jgi:hypothetical protein
LEPVVADCVDVLPFGAVTVNVTLAPEAGIPPLVTDAVVGTVPGAVKLDPETEMLTASDGGDTTVAFAVPLPVEDAFDAFSWTA